FSVSGIPTSAPTVTGVTPFDGSTAGGLAVTISGTNFANGANALFGTAPSGLSLQNCTVNNSTTMTCTTPPDNSGPKDLTVVNVDGKTGSLPGLPSPPGFSYTTNPPTVTGISPATSTTNGGAQITVTGTNFDPDATVNVGGLLPRNGFGIFGDNIVVNSSTSITFTTPAMTTGLQPDGTTPASPADVTVVNPSGADQGSAKLSGALTYTLGNGPINFIQRGDAALSNGTTGSVPIPMPNPQGKNNLNVVIVSWNDALAQVSQVVDSEGNTYVPAFLTPVTDGVALSQIIYYAKNIKGDTGATNNQINITFSRNANTPDVRVLEYSGLDPNSPLDQALSNAGTTTTADTGPCTTTAAVELIVAAATVDAQVSGAGPGFVTSDFTFNGNNAEQKITSTIGSCEAQTELSGPGWVTQVVSFKTPSGAQTPDFSMTAVPPTSATVNAGSSASYGVTMTALNGFNGSVDLACSGLPAGAGCLFSPASPVTPTSSGLAETVTISTQSATPSGMSSITIKGTSGNLNHSATVTLTVNGSTSPGFVLSASALSPGSVSAGGSATSTITVTPTNGFTGTVNLTCNVTGGGSPEPTCALSSSSVNGSGTSTLTASTTGNTAKKMHSTGIFYAMLLPIGGMTLLGAGFTSRRRKLLGILLICLVISGLVFMVACGGGSSGGGGGGGGGTPAGTYTITVQGTSGSINQSTTLTLTVQ
ncbi:MAG TPA: IPT/TIG domain-containing protein, partial [Terriglobales bacterium]|nr:IPT/TIG domain-containing protein [Terriglobales bacterium]